MGILGPSGSGKSTLMNCLATVTQQTTGQVCRFFHICKSLLVTIEFVCMEVCGEKTCRRKLIKTVKQQRVRS